MNKIGGISALVLAVALTGCATTQTELQPTTMNPGSAGHIAARETRNGNTKIDVQLEYLPPPSALGANTYVVWIRPLDGAYVNIGQVAIDEHRHGELETTTAHDRFGVLVTAENDPTARSPSKVVVLQGMVDKR